MTWRAISFDKKIYYKPLNLKGERVKLDIQLFLPPTDVPDSIEAQYDEKRDVFKIHFLYPDMEKRTALLEQDNVRLTIANSSGKPLSIEIKHLKKESIGKIRLRQIICKDVRTLTRDEIDRFSNLRKKTNLESMNQVLTETVDALVEAVPV